MKEIRIGSFTLESPFIMAPLAGITDAPMRRIAYEQGAALCYSEMVSAKGLFYGDANTGKLLTILPGEGPCTFQLFGSEPEMLRFAARTLADRENAAIDINMGCPVPKVVKNGEGSALMKDPELVFCIVEAAVKGAREGAEKLSVGDKEREYVPKPVTVKIRSGFTQETINCAEVARAAEAGGAAAIAVHGRTREQYYTGTADWTRIAEVRRAVDIPVIGNGDVTSAEDAIRMMDETGCDMVMIGRGALGDPWIFREANALYRGEPMPDPPTNSEKVDMFMRHLTDLAGFKGETVAAKEMRKFLAWYFKGIRGSAEARRRGNDIMDIAGFRELTDRLR